MSWKVILMVIASAALSVMLTQGAAAVQYPPVSTVPSSVLPTSLVAVTTTRPAPRITVPDPDPPRVGGNLARTGAGIATPLRIGVVLMAAGFVLYLVGRNRRLAKATP